MAVGKNPGLSKGGKKGGIKRKLVDVMVRKEWYDIVAPKVFKNRQACKTLVNKTQGAKLSSDNLKGRIFEVSLGDLAEDEQLSFRKMLLKVEEVQGRNCLTNFYGMTLTTDKLRSLIRKWCTLVEASQDIKTTDGYVLRVFMIGFTKARPGQTRKNCYAQSAQVRRLRRKMFEIMNNHISKSDLQKCVEKFKLETIGTDVQKAANGIYPLRDVVIRKVKVIKAPKLDIGKLLEIHGEIPQSKEDLGVPVEAEATEE
eukprot:NODE_6093_length_927_cov_344.490050_g5502_i0.p1 GENE.NODE_6093_length_927_cov_344.490050_g5502_i0~~NODE_6093_length_927_cov_344.490050_g5502_i0.p1  ORF type:complete len:256 (+),score=53.42 NODE_6093_length_927_cov_344.490050_g5502_i0:57-824(+)